jgi:hypothetical protein
MFFLGGALSGGLFSGWLLYTFGKRSIRGDPDKVVAHVPTGTRTVKVKRKHLPHVALLPQADGFSITVPIGDRKKVEVYGADALRAAGLLLPAANRFGGNREQVQAAVRALEGSTRPERFLHEVALRNAGDAITVLPGTVRLALEMAAHEESERRALEGELAELEAAWRAAEEIAAISDSLLLPRGVRQAFERLRGH